MCFYNHQLIKIKKIYQSFLLLLIIWIKKNYLKKQKLKEKNLNSKLFNERMKKEREDRI